MRLFLSLFVLFFPLTVSAAAMCPDISTTLRRGMTGEEVKQLQLFLIEQSLLAPDLATGYFGALTETAVRQFQCTHMQLCAGSPTENGYGQVGPATRAKIASLCVLRTAETPESTSIPVSSEPPVLESAETTPLSCPYYFPPECAEGALVSNGTDLDGCFLGYRCVISASTTAQACAGTTCPSSDRTPISCTLSGITLRDGQSYTFYSMSFSNYCETVSQLRFCTKGALDGDSQYIFPRCMSF